MDGQSITPFVFEGETVRVTERNGDPCFVVADVCRAVKITNASQAIRQLDEDEKGLCFIDTPGGKQEMLVVSESGLHTLVLRCRDAIKPGTLPHRFRRWVTGEVLPAIRRTGQFAPAAASGSVHPLPEMDWLRMVREARQTFGKRAAGQLWFASGRLPVVPAMRITPHQDDLFDLVAQRRQPQPEVRPDAGPSH